jgi:hypothetical protein
MKISREITGGGLAGLVLGLSLRIIVALYASAKMPAIEVPTIRLPQMTEGGAESKTEADIRQAAGSPSAEARAAVEAGIVKFVIRPGPNGDDADVARILLELGAVPICQNGDALCVWKASEGQWVPIRSSKDLNGYEIARAWALPRQNVLGSAAANLPSSAQVFLVLPTEQEMRVVGAVEQALQPHPLSEYARIELTLEKTPGGRHVQWALQRAVRQDSAELRPGTVLPI